MATSRLLFPSYFWLLLCAIRPTGVYLITGNTPGFAGGASLRTSVVWRTRRNS